MNQNKDNKKKILLTFAGNTDPIRNNYDGPILHICRYYKPEKIYLMLTSEMSEKDNETNLYEESIKRTFPDYDFILKKLPNDIINAHHYNVYFNPIIKAFEQIKEENDIENCEILVNLTSGTSQMSSNLINYILDSPYNITPLQVSTPQNKSNPTTGLTKITEEKDIELEVRNNIDNEPDAEKRILEPDLGKYSISLLKNKITELLNKYEYSTILELLRRNVFDEIDKLINLISYANDRKHLIGVTANNKLKVLNEAKYNKLYYYDKNETNDKKVKEYYKIVDYFMLADIKQKSNDVTGYILMLEPLTVNIYLSILRDIFGKKLSNLFNDYLSNDEINYKVNIEKLKKLENYEKLEKKIKETLQIVELRDNIYLSDKFLISLIEYFIEEDEHIRKKMSLEYFRELSSLLSKVKPIRNQLAHSFKAIRHDYFAKEVGTSIEKINKEILNFFKTYYSDYGYKQYMTEVYDSINKEIIDILERQLKKTNRGI